MGGWAALTELHLTGRIFGHMLLKLFAPQGLKCMTAAIQGVEFGGSGPLATQIAPLNLGSFHTGIIGYTIRHF